MIENTKEQNAAINHEKGDILVSASAGSGKTYVMIKRLIRLILENKAGVDEILAVTFTNLAAAEMKEKLIRAVTEEINKPDTPKEKIEMLKKQLSLIPTAAISTFHSFCNDLIKNYFYELGLDATFKIAEQAQADMLKQKAIDDLFEEKYESKDEGFKKLLTVFIKNRRDSFLKEIILSVYDFLVTEAYPKKEAERVLSIYTENGYEKIKTAFFSYYQNIFSKIDAELSAVLESVTDMGLQKQIDATLELKARVKEVLLCPDFLTMANCLKKVDLRLPQFKVEDGDEYAAAVKDRLSNLKTGFADEIKYLYKQFGNKTEEQLTQALIGMRDTAKGLVDLCLEFGERYAQLKKEECVVDFSDLEHFTLELLDKAEICGVVKGKYKYVFADEYQDTNGVQEEILSRVSDNNAFMVGDIKQSIYAFRGCNPMIFQHKFERFENGEGVALSLNANFRSSKAVLNCVNKIFGNVMNTETSGTDYASHPMLVGNGEDGVAEMYVITEPSKEENRANPIKRGVYSVKERLYDNTETEVFNEGVLIADIIRKTVSEPIIDAQGNARQLGYGDVVILTRSMGDYAIKLAEALTDNDIPVSAEIKNEIAVFPEVRALIALLRLVDCARQDAPLCAVMRGPIGNFTDSELAEIRAYSTANPPSDVDENNRRDDRAFWQAVEFYRKEQTDELKQKIDDFFEYIDKLRFLADFESAGELLERVVRERELDLYYLGKRNGKNRLKRINKLIFEASGNERAYTVKDFLARLDADVDKISITESGGEDSVRLMSIHASKGLEFPVVIVCGLNRKFNTSDIAEEIIQDREYGIALKTYDLENMKEKSNIFREFLKKRYRSNCIKEEMRILYVALTRAKSRLYLTQTAQSVPYSVSVLDVLQANTYAKLIMRGDVKTKILLPEDIDEMFVQKQPRAALAGSGDELLEQAITKNLSFTYPFNTMQEAKNSVTGILKGADERDENIPVLYPEEKDNLAIETGNAYHKVMELIDFNISSKSRISDQKQMFVQMGEMTEESARLVDDGKIWAVLSNEFFHISGAEYFRELQFEALIPGNFINDGGSDEEILVQGVIDLIAFTPNGIMIADYKVSNRGAEGLKETYSRQLDLYAYAAEKITGKKVIKKILFNLKRGEQITFE